MQNEILLAIIQAATEFLPISSSGHLAFASNLISEPNLFLITILHLASLLAVLIFTRKEIFHLLSFKKNSFKLWKFLIIATIPAALVGFLFNDFIESVFSSFLFLGIAFIFTGFILISTKFINFEVGFNWKSALLIGCMQALALFPGVSRSGMTISAALFSGIAKEKAAKISFLLFIPLSLGAVVLESGNAYFSPALAIAFLICFILSLAFLYLLYYIIKKGAFWAFGIYCFLIGLISLWIHFL